MTNQEGGVLTVFNFCPRCGSKKFNINNEKSKKCADCSFTYYLNPSAACAVFIHNAEGDLLVATRSKDPASGTFDLPGGFADMNETIEESLRREVLEETGLEVTHLCYQFSLPNEYEYSGFIVPTMDLFFRAEVKSFDGLAAHDDVSELQFIPFHNIRPKQFGLRSIRIGIEKYIKSKCFLANPPKQK